jgi:hypothetical protein
MSTTSKYFVLTPAADNLDFLDFNLNYGSVTTKGETIQYSGSSRVDGLFVRPGLTYDLSNTAAGVDKIYFTGNLSDYTLAFDTLTQTLTLSRGMSTPNQEMVKVAGGTALVYDNLIFNNGTVNSNTLAVAVKTATPLPVPNPTETSLSPIGAAAPGATLSASINAYSTNPASVGQIGETFASTKPGISLVVSGGNGVDTVYVANGETVDAAVLGASVDLIYFRGRWADYTKSTLASGTKLLFTRTIGGHLESVIVTAGTAFNHDKLIFADGAVTTDNALIGITLNPTIPLPDVPGVDPTIVTPLYTDEEVAAAIAIISAAAQANTAGDATTPLSVFSTAGITGVTPANLNAINDALNSLPVNGVLTDTKPEIQTIVDAYNAILSSADGVPGNTSVPLTGAQYTAVGVTGVMGLAAPGNALNLLDSAVDAKSTTGVDSVPELQAMADAAAHVIAAAGGTPAQVAALTLPDLTALGITGVTPDNLPAVLAAIGATVPDTAIDTMSELQAIVSNAAQNAANALAIISAAAQNNTAISSGLDVPVYIAAGVTGVTVANRTAIDSALDSALVNGVAADTTAEVQAIVNAYNTILASADGVAGNTAVALVGAQYNAIGVTGVSGFAAPGTALFLLDNVVDSKPQSAVDTEPKVQALADAANHVIAAAGGTPAQLAALTLADLTALGITGVTADTLPAVLVAIGATMPDANIDTQAELQAIVSAAALGATNALNAIRDAAQNNTAISTGLDIPVYTAAGVSGVTVANLISIDLALDSIPVTGAQADTTLEIQAIVNAYNSILASADGVANNTITPLTGAQYNAIGVTGVAGFAAPGNPMSLLDSAVDASPKTGVDTVVEVQAMADAANHVISAAGGTSTQIAALTLNDLLALGITGVTAANLPAVQAAVGAVASDVNVDTVPELQAIVNAASVNAVSALATIRDAAQNNNAVSSGLAAAVFAMAGVTGVTAVNQSIIDSALDSAAVTGLQADTTPEVQAIVDAYIAILASADGVANNTGTPLAGAQYNAIGVTGVSGFAVPGSVMALLDSAVDAKPMAGVDTEPEVQALADAANHVIAAAGGTPAQIAALTQADLAALGITGVTAANLPAVQAAVGAVTSDANVDTVEELQAVINAVTAGVTSALNVISAAAQANNAVSSGLAATVYAAAGVSGVTLANQLIIDSALDSAAITGIQADTTPEVQSIVDAYVAILASADGVPGNTAVALTGAQYTAIGVTGVSGFAGPGTALSLLDSAVDAQPMAGVDTEAEVQNLANAASHVLDAAGGTSTQIAALTQADLVTLGVTGVTAASLPAVLAAIAAAPDTGVDTLPELQALVNAAASNATTALNQIRDAAQNNNAVSTGLAASVYVAASVSGVTSANQTAIDSALDSAAITGAQADTTPEVQAIVDAYNAILASADGVAGNTATALTGAQYAAIGVTGVSGTATAGSALFLLDNVVDGKPLSAVDTEPEVQALADAASHVIAAAGGTPAQIAALTLADLTALGVTGVTVDNLPAILAAIGTTTPDTNIDTLSELQAIVNGAASSAANALNIIRDAAQNNTANDTTPGLSIYAAAGVTGVTAADLASINSALDSAAVTGAQADTTAEVQDIVNAYNAILSSADGVADNTATALTGPQYTLVGVTGVSGTSAPGNALHLLDSVVDASPMLAVDTVPELQAMADAAAHVITGAAAGTGPTLSDLGALGITGVTGANLASVQAGIAATPDNGTGVDTQAELQAIVTATINSHPNISTALSGVTNLDVTSNLVLNVDQSLTVGTGFIRITDMGGTGYQGDTSNNTQTIDVATAVANHLLTISGTGANTHIIINPLWDLDLASNYQITIDDGAFMNATGTQAASHIAPISFSTVAPGIHIAGTAATEAHASQAMVDATGALVAGKSWLDIQGIGNNTGAVTQLGDLSTGAYALVMKNYATQRGGDPLLGGNASDGIATYDTNIGVQNFGNNDIVYFDGQVNNSATQFFDARYTGMTDGANVGGLVGQNALVMGLVSSPLQQGSTAMILLGLEGNSANTVYPSIVSLPDGTVGWANVWHNTSPAVLMG